MKIAVGSDERTHLADAIVGTLREMEHEVILFGPLSGVDMSNQYAGAKYSVQWTWMILQKFRASFTPVHLAVAQTVWAL